MDIMMKSFVWGLTPKPSSEGNHKASIQICSLYLPTRRSQNSIPETQAKLVYKKTSPPIITV